LRLGAVPSSQSSPAKARIVSGHSRSGSNPQADSRPSRKDRRSNFMSSAHIVGKAGRFNALVRACSSPRPAYIAPAFLDIGNVLRLAPGSGAGAEALYALETEWRTMPD
jgi:hypothetical protein